MIQPFAIFLLMLAPLVVRAETLPGTSTSQGGRSADALLRAFESQASRSGAFVLQSGRGNQAMLGQSGTGQDGLIVQRGRGHSATLTQTGDRNTIILDQSGAANTAELAQIGDDNAIQLNQTGDSVVQWTQIGDGLALVQMAVGGSQSMSITQTRY